MVELEYRVGDLLVASHKGEVNVIGHGCNCFNTMGSGIAPQIKKAYPSAYVVDCATEKGDPSKLGTFTRAEEDGVFIYNIYSQFGYWGRNHNARDLDYDALRSALAHVRVDIKFLTYPDGGAVIGLPKIGAGLAGGDWEVIEKIIIEELSSYNLKVVIFTLE